MNESKRLFVGGLFPGVKEEQLRDRFGKFGDITSVEIKCKASPQEGQSNTFAFININITPNNLVKCFSVFSNCKWKGHEIKLQVAKESFLERLKKEKQGVGEGVKSKNPNFEPIKTNSSKKLDISVEHLPQVHIDHEIEPLSKPEVKKEPRPRKVSEKTEIQVDQRTLPLINKEPRSRKVTDKTEDVIYRLQNFSGSVWSDKTEEIGSKKSLSNEKRLKAIQETLMLTKSRDKCISSALKLALSGSKSNNRIVFDDDSGESIEKPKNVVEVISKPKRKALFEEDASDDESFEKFDLQPQFDGQSGQKLLELQAKFGNDDRFRLDKRFVETEENASFEDSGAERSQNLEILESIISGPVKQKKKSQPGLVRRYDPTKANCASLEVQREEIVKSDDEEEKQATEPEKAEVSTDRFFHVDSNLVNLFNKQNKPESSFSVLNTFGTTPEVGKDDVKEYVKSVKTSGGNAPNFIKGKNPFMYDSSSDDEPIDEKEEPSSNFQQVPFTRQTFFFSANDARLKEGLSFYKATSDGLGNHSKWAAQKERVTEMLKSQRKQFQRKNQPRNKKLKKQKSSSSKNKSRKRKK